MKLTFKPRVMLDVIMLTLFPVLLVNFFNPTLGFLISFFKLALLYFLLDPLGLFATVVPFVVLTLYYLVLFITVSELKEATRLIMLQAVIAIPIFAVWVERNLIHVSGYLPRLSNFVIEISFLVLVDILCLTFFVMIYRILKRRDTLFDKNMYLKAFYLWLNLAFLLSIALHLINSVDLVYYLQFHMPSELRWFFGYTPTILISITSLTGWFLCLMSSKQGFPETLLHSVLVIAPIALVGFIEAYRPLIGYVIISVIAWGSFYEFFRPLSLSLALVLTAVAAFLSLCIMLSTVYRRISRRNQLLLGLASAVLAGVSFSPVSVFGILTSLYMLLHGVLLEKDQSEVDDTTIQD